jgi:hypothetical protein
LFAIPAISLGAIAAPAAAAEIQIQSAGPVVELNVTESVKAKPDIATVNAGVSVIAPTAVEAMRQNAQAMSAVIARIKSLGIAPDDIQTTSINLNAQYDYDQAQRKQIFRGYQASNQVSVVLRNIAESGKVLDALVAAGVTDINGPSFSIEDEAAAKSQARKAAMDTAKGQAMEYAEAAGFSGVRLLEVSETVYSRPPQPMAMKAMDVAAQASTPVEPGLVSSSVTVSVKYEMTR